MQPPSLKIKEKKLLSWNQNEEKYIFIKKGKNNKWSLVSACELVCCYAGEHTPYTHKHRDKNCCNGYSCMFSSQ